MSTKITAEEARKIADDSSYLIDNALERVREAAKEGLTMVSIYIGDERSEENFQKAIKSLEYLGFVTSITYHTDEADGETQIRDNLLIIW